MIGLTRAAREEWGRYRVNVNSVVFGLISTRMTQAPADGSASINLEGRDIPVGLDPDVVEVVERLIPLGRGTPEEAAGAVYLFCCPESECVSGEVVVCGGGCKR